jgi:hypothetical protein
MPAFVSQMTSEIMHAPSGVNNRLVMPANIGKNLIEMVSP